MLRPKIALERYGDKAYDGWLEGLNGRHKKKVSSATGCRGVCWRSEENHRITLTPMEHSIEPRILCSPGIQAEWVSPFFDCWCLLFSCFQRPQAFRLSMCVLGISILHLSYGLCVDQPARGIFHPLVTVGISRKGKPWRWVKSYGTDIGICQNWESKKKGERKRKKHS